MSEDEHFKQYWFDNRRARVYISSALTVFSSISFAFLSKSNSLVVTLILSSLLTEKECQLIVSLNKRDKPNADFDFMVSSPMNKATMRMKSISKESIQKKKDNSSHITQLQFEGVKCN